MEQLTKSDVSFKVNGHQVEFVVYHQMENIPGLRLEDAIANWSVRTSDHSDKSLVDYINSKHSEPMAWTEDEFKSISDG